MLPKQNRLTQESDFRQVLRLGKSTSGRFFTLFVNPVADLENGAQFGVIVSNKVSKSAVKRNRLKRILRMFLKEKKEFFLGSVKVVVIAKKEACQKDKSELLVDLETIVNKYLKK